MGATGPLQVCWFGSPQGWRPFWPAPLRLSRLLGLRGSGRRKPQLQQRATGFIPAINQAGTCGQATDERWAGCCRAGSQGAAARQAASDLTVPLGNPRSQGGEVERFCPRTRCAFSTDQQQGHWGLVGGAARNPSAACPCGSHGPGLRQGARGSPLASAHLRGAWSVFSAPSQPWPFP